MFTPVEAGAHAAPEASARVGVEPGVEVGAHQETAAAVHVGLWVSATRCLLTYVVAPLVGALGVLLGPLGLLLQVAGAITATAGAHRLWVLRSRLRPSTPGWPSP